LSLVADGAWFNWDEAHRIGPPHQRAGTQAYRTSFNLDEDFDLSYNQRKMLVIKGHVLVDDCLQKIIINAELPLDRRELTFDGCTASFGDHPFSFTIEGPFLEGRNTIDFIVYNQGGPEMLSVKFDSFNSKDDSKSEL
jgi:hypothetical protein